MSAVQVSVAVLSWNGRHHLEHCLPALAEQKDPGVPWEILVLDNGSRDGTAEWLRREHPEVRLIESPTNLGFCAGNNRLVEEAKGQFVALLNNDTRPRPTWLRSMVEALEGAPSDVAGVSGLIVDWEGERLDFARGAMTFDGHAFQLDFRRKLSEVELPDAGSELLFACGGNMMVRRDSFVKAGGFDSDYFAYLEDVDLGWRLWSGGERILFAPEAVVHHRSAATSDLLGLYNRGFLFERNAYLTAYKNYDEEHFRNLMPAVLTTLIARTQALLVRNNPGGTSLGLDPYAGFIADTAAPVNGVGPAPPVMPSQPSRSRRLRQRISELGLRRTVRRGVDRILDRVLGPDGPPAEAHLTDGRSVAQIRALSYLVGHLGEAGEKRAAVQARRKRPDGEIFERFPLMVVPTYPGDRELFGGAGFRRWLPGDGPLEFRELEDIMEVGG